MQATRVNLSSCPAMIWPCSMNLILRLGVFLTFLLKGNEFGRGVYDPFLKVLMSFYIVFVFFLFFVGGSTYGSLCSRV